MIELPVGTRFYYYDRLVEVVEGNKCSSCMFHEKGNLECSYSIQFLCCERKDNKSVVFKEVKNG